MHRKLVLGPWLGFALVALLCDCTTEPDVSSYLIHFVVQVDEGKLLSDVPVYLDGKRLGNTGADGGLSVRVAAKTNQVLRAHADCPASYRGSDQPTTIHLRQFRSLSSAHADDALQYVFTCTPTRVSAAVIVSTSLPAELPLLMDGQEVGRTNMDGVAHLLIDAAPGSNFTLLLDTQGHPAVRPQYPTRTFYVGNQNEIYVYEQSLEIPKEKRPRKPSRRAARHLPIRIQ
jgi:hypothetical protein